MALDSTFTFGLLQCIASTILYGTAFVPIKRRQFGDGIYSLQIRSIAILIVGLVTYIWSDYPPFYPIAMVGGAFWAIANLIVLPCIGQLGLGVTVLLYSFTNCLTNWVTGNFGLFGTHARPPSVHWMNYIGLVALLIGGFLIAFIKPVSQQQQQLLRSSGSTTDSTIGIVSEKPEAVTVPQFTRPIAIPIASTSNLKSFNWKRVLYVFRRVSKSTKHHAFRAVFFSLVAGFFYGEDVTPVIYAQDRYKGAPQDGLSYCFAHYFGVFLTSSLVFIVYCAVKKNKPYINDELTLPSFVSGFIWGIAQTLFMVSVKHLSQSISGPIGAIFPACVASCWAVFYFKEIKGLKNYVMLSASIIITSFGAICIALSKELKI